MDRRVFIGRFFGGAAVLATAATLDPELLLWRPEAKTIFIPGPVSPAMPPIPFSPEELIRHPAFYTDIVMELNDLTLKQEGMPNGWTMIRREPSHGTFIPDWKL